MTGFFLQEYFQQSLQASLAAEAGSKVIVKRLKISSYFIELRFAGQALVSRIFRAVSHLEDVSGEFPTDLTIFIFDSDSTGIKMPSLSGASQEAFASGDLRFRSEHPIMLSYEQFSGVLSLLNIETSQAIYWVRTAEQIPLYESAAPMRGILHWWLRSCGLQFVHSAAIGFENKGAILAGKGGAGKSTTAVCCLQRGFEYAGDDYVLLQIKSPVSVFSVYNTAKIPAVHAACFSEHMEKSQVIENKRLVFFENLSPVDLKVHAIFLPRVVSGPPAIFRVSAAQVLRELSASTLFQLPGADETDFNNMTKVVTSIPVFVFELGSDFTQMVDFLGEFMSKL